jgi:uncharacterized membrane protein YdfJ with MMPL/SSD domain
MERWTRFVLRHRFAVVGVWAVALALGTVLWLDLGRLLSNEFSTPGTDSEAAREILEREFGQRDDGTFLVVFKLERPADPSLRRELGAALARGARALPGATVQPLQPAGDDVLLATVASSLELTEAKARTDDLRAAIGDPPGAERLVTGTPALQADLDPIFEEDLLRGEAIALPIALAVLLAVFGLSLAVLMPFIVAACTIMATLGVVWVVAHELTTAVYVTNLVQLIGLGIAIDYSLLIVYRFREELAAGGDVHDAIVRTMLTAGRAVVFSGVTVAIGLALLLFMPLPFMVSMGVGGFLIPLMSILAAVTLQPVLLSLFGRRGTRRADVAGRLRAMGVPLRRLRGTVEPEHGFWARLARSIMRRPLPYLAVGATALVAAAVPTLDLELTPGSVSGTPQTPEAMRGFAVLRDSVGPGALGPVNVVVDAGAGGRVDDPGTGAALGRLVALLRADPAVARVDFAPAPPFVDDTGRYAYLGISGRYEYGRPEAQAFARRLRAELVPASRFPPGAEVVAGGGPALGIDFIDQAYGAFPWLVLAVLVLTFVTLVRAFRSLLLPVKAVLLNLLAIGATYGLIVVVFEYGVGSELLGLYRFDQVEAWIPIFLFAMLFGLSMDYEVFLVTRMREFWDAGLSNEEAVAQGLERTGRIVTAAAIVMVAAFSGFAAGSIVGLQQFGLGLAIAIFLDATLIRAVLVPALMRLFGTWNWWLPAPLARVLRVEPSPLRRGQVLDRQAPGTGL